MKTKLKYLLAGAFVCAGLLTLTSTGCKTAKLEVGGVYAPTNSLGQVIYNDLGLALTDASYKFAYETAINACGFEKNHRAEIKAIIPSQWLTIKNAFDGVRDSIWEVDSRWAVARRAYKLNPTPAGLSTVQTILAEMNRLVPTAQALVTTIPTLTQPSN